MDAYIQSVIPGLHVWRCTEAIDPRSNMTFRTIGNPDGRCVEIVTPQNTMLFDRRLARRLADAILAICGPDEDLPSDQAQADIVQVVYDDHNAVAGFKPYVSPTGSTSQDAVAFIKAVRADAGLPPSSLLDMFDDGDQDTRI